MTENIFSNYHIARNHIHANKCHWHIAREHIWPKQAANLHENLSRMFSGLKKAGLQDIENLI